MRILGIELRRTTALLLGALVTLVMVGLLYWGPSTKNSTAWTRQWTTLAEWVRFMLVFSWPLTLAAGALQGLRDRRSGVEELFASTPRPRAQRVGWTLGALAVALIAAYVVVLAVGAVQVPFATDYFHWGWVPIALVGVLALVGAAWLGMGLGRLVPSPLVPPVLAVGGMSLMSLGLGQITGDGFRWTVLLPTVPFPRTVFASVAGSVSAVQAVWFAGVALSGFLLVALRRRWLGVLPVLVAGAVAVPLLPATPGEAMRPDPVAAELVCEEQLCLTRAHEHERAALAGPAREALRLLTKLPSPPTSVREVAVVAPVWEDARGPEPMDAVWVDLDDFTYFRRVPPTPERVTTYLLAGAGTRTCYGDYSSDMMAREAAARTVTMAWLTGRLESLPGNLWLAEEIAALAGRAWDDLRALPEASQAARVQAAREVLAACDGDPLAALTGGTA
ncbi:ABC transporter permease [Saccharothrix sp. ALI-22-I]|uniref:ABC transporter permease n=1 Tax=Saccharothrix sp. ALI-22-I TaxID=1933778 RepID=UPI00117A7683|nr:ABC transporter permease [Saccharothrix sp. ALI-22-I]